MVLAVAALLFQFGPIFQALPAAIPATPAAAAAAADAREPKSPDTTSLNTSMNAKLDPDLSAAHFEKDSASSAASSSAPSFHPAPITSAQNSQSLASIRIPAFEPRNKIRSFEPSQCRRAALGWRWLLWSTAQRHLMLTQHAMQSRAGPPKPIPSCGLSCIRRVSTRRFRWGRFCSTSFRGKCSAARTVMFATCGGCRNR